MNPPLLPTRTGQRLLAIVGWWNIAFAVLHVVIIFAGGSGYRYFGAGDKMARAAEAGDPKPTIITAGLTLLFLVFGLYALSAAGQFRRLPLARWAVLGIGVLYLLRGILVGPQAWWAIQHPDQVPLRFVLFSAVALLLGVMCVYGVMLRWKELDATPVKAGQHA
jgi:hypothetical protein